MDKSAAGLTTAIAAAALLVVFGSGVAANTNAVLVMIPGVGGVTTSVSTALVAMARLPRLQKTVPPMLVQLPWVVAAETNATPGGNASVTVTLVATDGPRFVTVSV